MKIWLWAFSSSLLVAGTALAAGPAHTPKTSRTAFLGQTPKAMLDKESHLVFEEVAKYFDRASTDVRAEDFEALSRTKFRLTSQTKDLADEDSQDLVFPSFMDENPGEVYRNFNTCQTVDQYGEGHESNAFRYESSNFVFSGGWVPGETGSSLAIAMAYMHGKSVPTEGYRIDIPENSEGFYSDFPAPLSVTYRRSSANLIAAFRNENGETKGFKVCFSKFHGICHLRGAAKGRYEEPAVSFTNIVNLLATGDNLDVVKSEIILKAKRDLGCLVSDGDSVEDYVQGECRGGAKSAACETAKNACAAYVNAKKEMQCGNDLSGMNFFVFDKKTQRWLPATSN